MLVSSDLQFGFKQKHLSLRKPLNTITTITEQYTVLYLMQQKAFDRIQYCKLFRKLLHRKLSIIIVLLFFVLLNMYSSQRPRIVWNNQYSDWFEIKNGVKQGGVLSPVLFCVFRRPSDCSQICWIWVFCWAHVYWGPGIC